MSKFLPNLPNDNVKTVVMSTEFQNISKAIGEVGIKILPTKPIEKFYPFEKSHADMQFFHYSSDTAFILKESLYLKEELEKYIENNDTVRATVVLKVKNHDQKVEVTIPLKKFILRANSRTT